MSSQSREEWLSVAGDVRRLRREAEITNVNLDGLHNTIGELLGAVASLRQLLDSRGQFSDGSGELAAGSVLGVAASGLRVADCGCRGSSRFQVGHSASPLGVVSDASTLGVGSVAEGSVQTSSATGGGAE